MKRNKKNVLNSQYLINYDEFDELNETPNILNGTVKRGIRCSGCNINSKDLVDSILHFSGYERANVGNILDFQFYSCDIENKEQTYTLFVLPQFLTLNHKR